MTDRKLADIDFKLEWKSPFAEHIDIYHVSSVDPDNDKFPLDYGEKVAALKVGESCSQTFQAKDVLDEGYSTNKVMPFESDLFDTHFKDQYSPPILYRFYPSAIAWQGLDTDATDYTPFRLISMNGGNIVADRNHPLAKYYLTLSASKISESDLPNDSGRRRRHIGKLITSRGPGMQAPFEYGDPVFFDRYPFERTNDQEPLEPQLDSMATEQITSLYSELLPKHSKVLDLMSSKFSYLADGYETGLLAGIGTNEEALSANQRLDTFQVQDLNNDATLPFETNSYDDAICTLSIESLTDPLKVIKEVARVVNSGGKFIITFSDSRLPPQAISLWAQLHPFERIQLVLEYFRQSGLFKELNTFSKRGVLIPSDDKHLNDKRLSDSVYAVWGFVK